jgi:hypothetical protein
VLPGLLRAGRTSHTATGSGGGGIIGGGGGAGASWGAHGVYGGSGAPAIDFVDINLGCPLDAVCAQGAGAGLCWRPELQQVVLGMTEVRNLRN